MNVRDRITTAVQALRGEPLARVEVSPGKQRLLEMQRNEQERGDALVRQGAAIAVRQTALRRQRAYRSGIWKAAEVSRLTSDFNPGLMPTDDELRGDLRALRARARDLSRNEPLMRKYRSDLAVNVIGPDGPTLEPRTMLGTELDQATNQRIRDAWKDWSEGAVTVDGRHDLVSLEHLLWKTMPTDGEYICRLFRGFEDNEHGIALQPVDCDYLDENHNLKSSPSGNEIRLGVEVNGFGRPVAYHLARELRNVYGITIPTHRDRIPADEIIHEYISERISQTRGVTWMASVIYDVKQLGAYFEAETTAARVAAAKMGFFVSKDGAAGEMASADADRPTTMDAAPGTAEALPPGWEWQGWDPQHPAASFPFFTKAVMRRIASGLLISYNGLANDLEGVNYSSMRSGVISERDFYRLLQRWHIKRFRRRVYYEWLAFSLLTGALELGTRDWRRFKAHTFTPRGWQWVDPEKDVNALASGIALGIDTRTSACAELGHSFDETLATLAAERKMAVSLGLELQDPLPPGGVKPEPAAPPGPGGSDGGDGPPDNGGRSLNGHAPPRNRLPA